MTTFLTVHHEKPQPRLIRQAAEKLEQGGVAVYPTDSYYAIGCLQSNKKGIEQIRLLRGLDDMHFFTLSCRDIGQINEYAQMDNTVFRLIKSHIPGAYTFILKAGKSVAKKLYHPARRTVAFRVQSHPVTAALLAQLSEPLITTTLKFAGEDAPPAYEDMRERLKNRVDVTLDAGICANTPTTVLDFTENPPRLVREGGGKVETIDE